MSKVSGPSHSRSVPIRVPAGEVPVEPSAVGSETNMAVGSKVAPVMEDGGPGLLDAPTGYSQNERQGIVRTMLAQINAGDAWLRARLGVRNPSQSAEGCKVTLHLPCSNNVLVNVTYVGGADTYSVESFKIQPRRAERMTAYMIEDIYAEQLAQVVDKAFQKAVEAKPPRTTGIPAPK